MEKSEGMIKCYFVFIIFTAVVTTPGVNGESRETDHKTGYTESIDKSCIVPITYRLSMARLPMKEPSRNENSEFALLNVLNKFPTGADQSEPYYECSLASSASVPNSLVYGRYATTRNVPSRKGATAHKPLPPAVNTTAGVRVNLNPIDPAGIYYCSVNANDGRKTTVTTTFMLPNAKIVPADGMVTQTVSLGDTGISIDAMINEEEVRMQSDSQSKIKWRKDDVYVLRTQEGQARYVFHHPVMTTDAGVYESYLDGERNVDRKMIKRLIVRACPAGKWGPPSCSWLCDKCYNGGVCDDITGKCICPPGFRGENCLTACGTNTYGFSCDRACNSTMTSEDGCLGIQFCLPDPYGCTCGAGFTALNCTQPCTTGFFGASCTQPCRCSSGQCNPFTGECLAVENNPTCDCHEGWTGPSCQIPTVCETGYYGENCTKKCYCSSNLPCDKESGQCDNSENQEIIVSANASIPCNKIAGSSSTSDTLETPKTGEVSSAGSIGSDLNSPALVLGVVVVLGIFLLLQIAMFLILRQHDKILKRHRRFDETLEFSNKMNDELCDEP